MNKKLFSTLIVNFIFIIQLAHASPEEDKTTVVKGNDPFAVDLYHQLKNQEGNLFFF